MWSQFISTVLFKLLIFTRELKKMDGWLHECQSKRSFYSRDEEILPDRELEIMQKISSLDDIFQEYTVCFLVICIVDGLAHIGRPPCINMSRLWWIRCCHVLLPRLTRPICQV
jgi:hypothetical protein